MEDASIYRAEEVSIAKETGAGQEGKNGKD